MDYPVWNIAVGGSILMGIVAITHVIVSHFAVGGGLVIAVTETLANRRSDEGLRQLARRSSLVLILVSTVFGAISGVGIWIVAGLISPAAIATLIRNYVWGWAIEWVFFIVELLAALLYFATWDKVRKSTHEALIWIYFVAAYLSLVIINGIITFMLTPGRWLQTHAFWDGFFNPTYFPSLVLRTGIAAIMAAAFMLLANTRSASADRPRLSRYLGLWLVAGTLVAYAGFRWWEAMLPAPVQAMAMGVKPLLPGLAVTRHLLMWSLTAALALAAIFLLALPRAARLAPVLLIVLASFVFFGSYERLREGVRKPFLIHDHMFSNGLRVDQIAALNETGTRAGAGWSAADTHDAAAPTDATGGTDAGVAAAAADAVATGRRIFQAECSRCHTIDGYQGIRRRLPDDAGTIEAILTVMHEQGVTIAALPPGQPIDTRKLDYPFMPPFVGTQDELDALVQYLASLSTPAGAKVATTGGAQ